uniref:SAP domain-containing protein n=1 Tax=Kalmanozyma brasiliensis (strain GHG001) TaxID=1365824 RepID=V5ET55_KALBG
MYSRWSGSSQHAVNSASSGPTSSTGTGMGVNPASYLTNPSSNNPNLAPPTSSSTGSSPSSSSATLSGGAQSSSTRRTATVPVASGAAPGQSQKQYIILKLDKPSVARSITFGKYHKPHPCNLRDFKVYGSASIDSLLPSSSVNGRPPASKRLLRGGLKNDAIPETFELRWLEDAATGSGSGSSIEASSFLPADGEPDRRSASNALVITGNAVPFAIRYVKIVPLAAHTPNYNFSIWHVALAGVSEPALVARVARSYEQHRQSTATRLILKHLREHGHLTAFQALLQSSRLAPPSQTEAAPQPTKMLPYSPHRPFEHPLLTTLFDALVRRASWDEVELCLNRAAYGDLVDPANSGSSTPMSPGGGVASPTIASLSRSGVWTQPWQKSMFSSYISRQIPKASWSQIHPMMPSLPESASKAPTAPSGRGGHAMVFDPEKGIAYLFGGWDGHRDLSDLWAYHVNENRWRLISPDTQLQGGPSPRSCHKMALDEKSGCIYLLGRYIDYESANQSEAVPADSMAHVTRSTATALSSAAAAAMPVTPSSSTARTTRANFLARYPESIARDIHMILGDSSPQIDDVGMEGAGAGGQSTSVRGSAVSGGTGSAGSTSAPASNSESSPLLFGGGGSSNSSDFPESIGRSPRAASRLQSSVRTDSQQQRPPSMSSPPGREADLFRFSTRSERWERLSADTYADGGPKLIFDHGLVIDAQNQMMYVFGGRVTDPDPAKFEFSGMWRYDIIQRSWTFLFDDRTSNGAKILSRSGHSMLLDSGRPGASGMSPSHTRQIWILGGQRGASATFLADMYTYNLATGAVREVSRNTAHNGPEAAFTQRATIDVAAREISVFIGLIGGRNERKRSAFWIYSIPRSSWRKVYQYEGGKQSEFASEASNGVAVSGLGLLGSSEDGLLGTADGIDADGEMEGDDVPESGPLQALPTYSDEAGSDDEEMPIEPPTSSWTAYAGQNALDAVGPAQLVFDDRKKVYYLHGGNPEDASDRSYRLDDFWRLTLLRPTPGEILRRAKFRVRRQRFLEMTRNLAPAMNDSEEEIATAASVAPAANSGGFALDGGPRFGLEALMYLQTEVGAVVDHSDESESRLFRRLMSHLLSAETGGGRMPLSNGDTADETLVPTDRTYPLQGIGSSPLNPHAHLAASSDWTGAAGSKRTREEAETDEAEMASSVSSLMSGDDAGSEMMLSASQVLQHRLKKAVPRLPTVHVRDDEGRPGALYVERTKLFRELIEYFNPELVEPRAELGGCIEVALGGVDPKMESKLQSLKVAELKALLTTAGLGVSGNKPDLIARLLENPSATASLGGGEAAPAPASTAAPSAPAPAPVAPAASTATPAAAPAAPAPAPAADETGPSEEQRRQALILELEKRKARAAKFGTPLGEAERKLERAIKFGLDPNDEANVAKLGQALGARPASKGERKSKEAKTEAKEAKTSQPKESEEEKAARLKREEEEKEKARKRAERFGIKVDDEGKRKRDEGVNGAEKKVRT